MLIGAISENHGTYHHLNIEEMKDRGKIIENNCLEFEQKIKFFTIFKVFLTLLSYSDTAVITKQTE